MLRASSLVTALAAAVLAVGGCNLNVENPNAPDKNRAFADPAGLAKLVSGAFRTWVGTRGDYFGALPMTAMADNYTASWNNAAIRFYNSVGVDCPSRCGWTNSATAPEAAGGPSVASQWYGYYTVLVSANAVLDGIKNKGVCFDDDCSVDSTLTSRNRVIAKMLQGMALAGIALVYDQGFVVDETTDLTNISTIPFSTRAEVRDAALLKFEEAWTEAGLHAWSTENEWMGVGAGQAYTNTQIRQVIRTMQAELVAMWPRNAAENGAADWASVATYASQGVSFGAPFDWTYFVDITGRECGDLDCVKTWGNSIGTMRVDTRVATMVAPVTQESPWPLDNPVAGLNASITASASAQTVTPLDMTNIRNGRWVSVGCVLLTSCTGGEYVLVQNATASTFDAVFAKNHPGPTTLATAVDSNTKADTTIRTVTPASMAGIEKGSVIVIDVVPNAEVVYVDSVTATTFLHHFKKHHAAGAGVAQAIHRNAGGQGNPCPTFSPDRRVGDGSYGPSDDFNGYATLAATANAGTDFACSGVAIFPPARGSYHQSNLQHIRYQHLAYEGEDLPSADGTGPDPFYTTQMNDLLWAEGLIRSGGSAAQAATLINNSRVGRGGLAALTGAETVPELLTALQYEQEIEFMGQGPTPFFNRRRIDGFGLGSLGPSVVQTGTPRHMPVPAQELDVLQRANYTFGGPSAPELVSRTGGGVDDSRTARKTVRQIWEEYVALRRSLASRW